MFDHLQNQLMLQSISELQKKVHIYYIKTEFFLFVVILSCLISIFWVEFLELLPCMHMQQKALQEQNNMLAKKVKLNF